MTQASTATWADITAWTNAEIEAARTALEQPGLSSPETEVLRARIVVLRQVQTINQIADKPVLPPPVPYT